MLMSVFTFDDENLLLLLLFLLSSLGAVFRGYVVLTQDSIELFLPENKTTPEVEDHLHIDDCEEPNCVT